MIFNVIVIVVVIVFGFGCEDDKGDEFKKYLVYIDENCTDRHIANIKRAIFRSNEMTNELMGQDMIVIADERHPVDYDWMAEWEAVDDDINQLACFYKRPDWWGETDRYTDKAVGHSDFNGGDIKLFLFQGDEWPDWFVVTVTMHELMHFLGVRGHIDDPNSVSGGNSTVYTDADKEYFCRFNHCLI